MTGLLPRGSDKCRVYRMVLFIPLFSVDAVSQVIAGYIFHSKGVSLNGLSTKRRAILYALYLASYRSFPNSSYFRAGILTGSWVCKRNTEFVCDLVDLFDMDDPA